jgi:2-(1,2-epoxy-1,2-dihydrophenyl)acetyl-CoA isomerase
MVSNGREHPELLVRVDRADDRAIVTLDDPAKLNTLSAPLVQQLKAALEGLCSDEEIRAIVLTGADPGFSAGGDLRMMEDAPAVLASPGGATDIWRWIRYEFCDLAIASERARIVPAFGRLGLLPEVGTSWAITRRLGYQGAFAYYTSGEHLDAERARQLGLVHEVVAHDQLLAAADAWCTRVAALPAHALAMTKPLLRAAADGSWEGTLAMEEFAEPQCFTTGSFKEAVQGMLRAR